MKKYRRLLIAAIFPVLLTGSIFATEKSTTHHSTSVMGREKGAATTQNNTSAQHPHKKNPANVSIGPFRSRVPSRGPNI